MPVMRLILCYYWVYQFIANLKLIIRYEDLIDKGVLLLIHGTAANHIVGLADGHLFMELQNSAAHRKPQL